MNIRLKENQKIFFHHLFSLLSLDKKVRPFSRESLLQSVKDCGVSRELLSEWVEDWKKSSGTKGLSPPEGDGRGLIFLLCSALLYDEEMNDDIKLALKEQASKAGVNGGFVDTVFESRETFLGEASLFLRAEALEKAYGGQSRGGETTRAGKSPQDSRKSFFVANQVTYEGFDELQRLLMCRYLGVHTAIDGPPGVGKTHSVIEVSRILGMRLYTKTCSSRTTESHIISYPVLTVREGASITGHANGPLVSAMLEPGIFYGDEFNLLKEDVQKRLNSAFDERRYIDRNDGVQIEARPGFWGVISYNPTQNLTSRDLEDSVADRFVHLHYGRWNPDFKA